MVFAVSGAMFEECIAFLRKKGAVYGWITEATVADGTALYHWASAEVTQSDKAVERLGLAVLLNLPWVYIKEAFEEGAIALKGMWDWNVKSVSKAVGEASAEYKVEYPEGLSAGGNAMVMALRAYQRGGDVLASPEMKLVGEYLEIDCKGLWQILRWLRASACGGEEVSSPRAVKGRSTGAAVTGPSGWYRCSLAMMAAGKDFPARRPPATSQCKLPTRYCVHDR